MSSSRLFLDGMLSSSARLRFARPRSECVKVVLPVEKFAANGELSLNCLSHPRGQPHPKILSQEEVTRLIDASSSLFERTLLMVLYGLRMRSCHRVSGSR